MIYVIYECGNDNAMLHASLACFRREADAIVECQRRAGDGHTVEVDQDDDGRFLGYTYIGEGVKVFLDPAILK